MKKKIENIITNEEDNESSECFDRELDQTDHEIL